jgi:hypothetical protein
MSLTDVEIPITKVATQASMLKVREKPHCYGATMHDHKKTSGSGCFLLLLACILFASLAGWGGGMVMVSVGNAIKLRGLLRVEQGLA